MKTSPYLLKYIEEPLPDGYRLMTVEEVLKRSVEVTQFLAYEKRGFERSEYYKLQKSDYKRMLGHNKEIKGIIKLQLFKEPKADEIPQTREIPHLCNFTLEMVLQSSSKERKPIRLLVNEENGFNEYLKVEFDKWKINVDNEEYYQESDEEEEDEKKEICEEKEENNLQQVSKTCMNEAIIHSEIIDKEIPEGYRLATLEELLTCVEKRIEFLVAQATKLNGGSKGPGVFLMLRRSDVLKAGKDRDNLEFGATYFSYDSFVISNEVRIRLKNGFIEKQRRLVWKDFTVHEVYQQLAVLDDYYVKLTEEDQVVELLFACFFNHDKEVIELLENPNYFKIMSTNHKNAPFKGSALHVCGAEGSLDCLKAFWRKLRTEKEKDNACAAKADMDEQTPLHLAVVKGQEKVVKMLCRRESINKATKKDKMTPLMLAAQYHMENEKIWGPILACEGLRLDNTNKRKNNVFHLVSDSDSEQFDKNSKATLLKKLLELCGRKVSRKAYQAAGKEELDKDAIAEVAELYRKNSQFTGIKGNDSSCINSQADKLTTPLHKSLGICEIDTCPVDDDIDSDDDDDDD
eukprot:c19514_g1_i2 orf=3-1721(-)